MKKINHKTVAAAYAEDKTVAAKAEADASDEL